MIKKSTLLVLLAAVMAGAAVYYFDWKRGQKEAENAAADTSNPRSQLQADDISSLSDLLPGGPEITACPNGKTKWRLANHAADCRPAPMTPRCRES